MWPRGTARTTRAASPRGRGCPGPRARAAAGPAPSFPPSAAGPPASRSGPHPRWSATARPGGSSPCDRARRAYAHTLAAPGAPRLVRVAVRADDDLGVLAPLAHVEHADHLNVLACPHAARAQNTGRHVVPDHRVAGPLVPMAQDEVALPEGGGNDPIPQDVLLELVERSGPLQAIY